MMIGGPFAMAVAALVVGSTLVCTALLMGAFRRRAVALPAGDKPARRAREPFVAGRTPFLGARLDVGQEVRAVLEELASEAPDGLVVADLAIAPDLSVHADRDALQTILNLLVCHAARQAREKILVSAVRRGGRVQIAVTDDGSGASEAEQQAILRPVAELAALQGSTFDIETWPGQGTTITVRLLEPVETQRPPEQDRRTAPASQPLEDESELAAEASWET